MCTVSPRELHNHGSVKCFLKAREQRGNAQNLTTNFRRTFKEKELIITIKNEVILIDM